MRLTDRQRYAVHAAAEIALYSYVHWHSRSRLCDQCLSAIWWRVKDALRAYDAHRASGAARGGRGMR